MSGMRRAIASRLQTSKQQSPHFRLSVDLDLERLLALRQDINREVPGVKISVNDLLVKACALALVAVPDVNIQFDEAAQSIRRFTDADISVAVALPAGLITYCSLGEPEIDQRHIERNSLAGDQSQSGHAEAGRVPGRDL